MRPPSPPHLTCTPGIQTPNKRKPGPLVYSSEEETTGVPHAAALPGRWPPAVDRTLPGLVTYRGRCTQEGSRVTDGHSGPANSLSPTRGGGAGGTPFSTEPAWTASRKAAVWGLCLWCSHPGIPFPVTSPPPPTLCANSWCPFPSALLPVALPSASPPIPHPRSIPESLHR